MIVIGMDFDADRFIWSRSDKYAVSRKADINLRLRKIGR